MSEIPFLELCISLNYFLKSGHFEQFKIIFQRTKIQSEDHVSLLLLSNVVKRYHPSLSNVTKCILDMSLSFFHILYICIYVLCEREKERERGCEVCCCYMK
ncbi:partitioning defective 3-like protein [Platysternon megacephalum]|uniref:Partitioning defective 3-like protein n=1 Tax=Platysternon megacephalum TaxID=55544 RepID=A0A4D9EN91_9SAUR|nr:partitioning defective 3-like protein [Platysternon megacephalum]